MYSIFKNLAISRITSPYIAYLAISHTIRLATPPPIYRAILPPPLAYKAYLIVQNLYMRYAPLKSIYPAKLALKLIRIASYLIVQDLYKRFHKSSKKPRFGIVNRTTVFGSKLLLQSASLVGKASIKSIGKNTGKVVYSITKSLYSQIGPSAIKPVFGLKGSLIKSSQASHSNIKTLFSLWQKWNAQALTIQSPCYIKSSKYTPIVNVSNSVFRSYTTPLFNLTVTVKTPTRFLKQISIRFG